MLSQHSTAQPAGLLAALPAARTCPVLHLCCCVRSRHLRPVCARGLSAGDCQRRPRLLLAMSAARRLGGRGPRGALVITRWRPEGAAAAGGDVDAAGSPRAGAASPLTPGGGPIGGETEQAERGVIIGVCEQFVWAGVAGVVVVRGC